MKFRIMLLLLFGYQSYAQDFKEKTMDTKIEKVTVFLQNAQVFRTGNANLPAGRSVIVVKNLSPYLDDKSIQVKAEGDFTILSVNHQLNYLNGVHKSIKADSLQQLIDQQVEAATLEAAKLEVLKEKQSLLNENKNLGGQNAGVSLAQLSQAIDFYEKQITAIKKGEIAARKHMVDLQKTQEKLQQQLNELNTQPDLPTAEIEIRVDAPTAIAADFQITYLVGNAGWYPKYDVRVKNIESPIELVYKAEVYQHTGNDWDNVHLTFSNGDPNQSGVAPELETWYLNFARNTIYQQNGYLPMAAAIRNVSGTVWNENGEPLPGINVIVKGTTVGTVTNVNGHYTLTLPNNAALLVFSFVGYTPQEIPITHSEINVTMQADNEALQEVVATGYSDLTGRMLGLQVRSNNKDSMAKIIATTVAENQTTVEFEVAIPYSIKSNGEQLSVDLNQYEIEADYEYYAVPKLDKDAFLVAKIINWDQYNLLEGEANLYFEDAYVGRTVLDAKALTDTLNISLGRDKNIVISRTKIDQFSKTKFLGSNKVETRGYKILVRNKKSQPIQLTLLDQLPVSAINDITINPTGPSNEQLNEATGEITWDLSLEPQQQTELNLQYEVKYPKQEKVILE